MNFRCDSSRAIRFRSMTWKQRHRLLQCNEKTIRRAIPAVLDQLSEILLEVGLLEKLNPAEENSCQGGRSEELLASDCQESEKIF
jgi:hypothetical protein